MIQIKYYQFMDSNCLHHMNNCSTFFMNVKNNTMNIYHNYEKFLEMILGNIQMMQYLEMKYLLLSL